MRGLWPLDFKPSRAQMLLFLVLGVNAISFLISFYLRPLTPIDETRYIAVAAEMKAQASYIVPYLNQAPYFHKPVLLFWIINLAWAIFGTSEIIARISVSFFSLACLSAVYYLAPLIYPHKRQIGAYATIILSGILVWSVFSITLMFDCMLSFFILLQLHCMLLFAKKKSMHFACLAGFFLGLALLTKGPIALIYTLPSLLIYPLWHTNEQEMALKSWYKGLALCISLSLFILGAWAFSAAYLGGEDYSKQLLWHQTVDRISGALAHRRPWYWYLPFIPLIVFPFSLCASFGQIKPSLNNKEDRLCLSLIGLPFVFLSAFGGKQLHYLIPMLPFIAIFFAAYNEKFHFSKNKVFILSMLSMTGALFVPFIGHLILHAKVTYSYEQMWALCPLLFLLGYHWSSRIKSHEMVFICLCMPICLLTFLGSARQLMLTHYDMKKAAHRVQYLQEQGIQVGFWGHYDGQYQFYGHLEKKVIEAADIHWLHEHPKAVVLVNDKDNPLFKAIALQVYPFRDKQTYFIPSEKLLGVLCQKAENRSHSFCDHQAHGDKIA